MAFSKAMPEAFRVTLFNGSRDNDEVKKPRVFIRIVSVAQLLAKQLCVVVWSSAYLQNSVYTCDARSFRSCTPRLRCSYPLGQGNIMSLVKHKRFCYFAICKLLKINKTKNASFHPCSGNEPLFSMYNFLFIFLVLNFGNVSCFSASAIVMSIKVHAAAQCRLVNFFGGPCRVPRRVQIMKSLHLNFK